MSKGQTLRDLVMERLVVAADEIFALFEQTLAQYEQEALRTKGVQTVNLEVVPSPEPVKEEPTLCIKQEADPPLEDQEPPEETREEPGCSLDLQSDNQTYSCSDTDDWEPSAKTPTTCDGQEPKTVGADPAHSPKQMSIHSRQGPFVCPVCKMTFSYQSCLNRHLNTHKEEKPFSCSVCKKSFSQEKYLKRHLSNHTGEKSFSCPECGLKLKHRKSIFRHISIVHRREKPYSCPVCKKAFAQKSYLITHMRIHTGEKPFSCTVCYKRFLAKTYLKKHLTTHRTHAVDKIAMKD